MGRVEPSKLVGGPERQSTKTNKVRELTAFNGQRATRSALSENRQSRGFLLISSPQPPAPDRRYESESGRKISARRLNRSTAAADDILRFNDFDLASRIFQADCREQAT